MSPIRALLSAALLMCGIIASAGPENTQALLESYRQLSNSYQAAGDMKNAYLFARRYSSLQDSIWAARTAGRGPGRSMVVPIIPK